ncbi:hypothetical protein L1049_014760 [Liquidambar formosana]|uniref:Bet v I/Major latex protein domain-containing protein n=1 Tax=Liquidambar formosana TaxID=63359 RepID=A0AAP0S2K7_LIQFO
MGFLPRGQKELQTAGIRMLDLVQNWVTLLARMEVFMENGVVFTCKTKPKPKGRERFQIWFLILAPLSLSLSPRFSNLLLSGENRSGVEWPPTAVVKLPPPATSFSSPFSPAVNPPKPDGELAVSLHSSCRQSVPRSPMRNFILFFAASWGFEAQLDVKRQCPLKTLKHRIDALDKENMIYNYTMIEGDTLPDKIESISYETKFEATADGRTICKSVSKHYAKAGVEIKEEEIKAGKEKATGMFKAVEAYLLANPDAYA